MRVGVAGPEASATASPNIALIKYWGKSDARLNLPLNASLSLTVSVESMRTTTRANLEPPAPTGVSGDRDSRSAARDSPSDPGDTVFLLNGKAQDVPKRILDVVAFLRSRSPLKDLPGSRLRVTSENSFYTSCGLASSASGACAAVRCLDALFRTGLDAFSLSALARYVSGSGARSQFSGAVLTVQLHGEAATTYAERAGLIGDLRRARELSTSIQGTPFAGLLEWTAVPLPVHQSLRAALTGFVVVLDGRPKGVGSTRGMLAMTDPPGDVGGDRAGRVASLLSARLREVPTRISAVCRGLEQGDLATVISNAEEDWREMHRLADVSLGSSYLTPASWEVYAAICAWRDRDGGPTALVTFDAGPNPCVICLRGAKEPLTRLLSGLTTQSGDPLAKEFIDLAFTW